MAAHLLPIEATAPRLTVFREVLWEVARRNNAFPEEDGLGRPVWMHYRPDLVKFTAEEWDETRTYPPYPADSRVYYPGDGNCYKWYYNTDTTAGQAPDGFYWQVIPFLTILFEAVVAGAHAMTKTTEGQAGTATAVERMMIEHLEQELQQMTVQEGQARFLRVA
jgi:hypothetical protein